MSAALGPPYDPNDLNGDGMPDHAGFVDSLDEDQLSALERIMGVDRPPVLDTTQETAPPLTRGQSALQSFAGLENQQQPPARNFLEGLVGGATRGLGAAGTRSLVQRAKVEEALAKRQAERDAGNARATAEYRAGRRAVGNVVAQDALARSRRQTPAQIEADAAARARGTAAGTPPKQETPAERRANAAAERAVAAAERQNKTAAVGAMNSLANEYRQDKRITGYTNLRSNVLTGESAAKLKTGPGDIALIFSYMRSLEPENPNAVREGEYASARDAQGAYYKTLNLPARYFQGDQLSQPGRDALLAAMRSNLRSRRPTFDEANDQFTRRAKVAELDPSLILATFPQDTTAAAPAGGYRPKSWTPVP